MRIEPYDPSHLPQLTDVLNRHLGAVVPGWSLPAPFLARRLRRNPDEPIVDPWVVQRRTLCGVVDDRVVGGVHVLRYGEEERVGDNLRSVADVAWLVSRPDVRTPTALLEAALETAREWGSRKALAMDVGPPVSIVTGIPGVWPHVAEAFGGAGFTAAEERAEVVYSGWIQDETPSPPPMHGIELARDVGEWGMRFQGVLDGERVGLCGFVPDLTMGGALSRLDGWGELVDMWVRDDLRERGIGTWLARHAAAWMRSSGCTRVVLAVDSADERAGAGRFYERLDWSPTVRLACGWMVEIV